MKLKYRPGDHVAIPETGKEWLIEDIDETRLHPYHLVSLEENAQAEECWLEEGAFVPAKSNKTKSEKFKEGDRVSFTDSRNRTRVGTITTIRNTQCGPIYSVKANECTWEIYGENALSLAQSLIDPKEAISKCRKLLTARKSNKGNTRQHHKNVTPDNETDISSEIPGNDKRREYKRGLRDAWDLADRVINMPQDELKSLYGTNEASPENLFSLLPAEEVLNRLKTKSNADSDEIKTGDKVFVKSKNSFGIVSGIISPDSCSVLCRNGLTSMHYYSELTKTGEYFDIKSILAELA